MNAPPHAILALLCLGSLAACGGSSSGPPASASTAGDASVTTAAVETSAAEDAGAPKAEEDPGLNHALCTGTSIDLDNALIQRACEVPSNSDAKAQDLKNVLQVKALASPTKATPGGHVDVVLTYMNKGGRPLPLEFKIDPVPRFLVEAYDAKGSKRVDLPKGSPPPPPKDATERLPSREGTARIIIAPYGVAHVKIGWDAIRTKWAPELYKGTPIEMGYPRKPAGNLPAGKYQLRIATPLLHVVEGDDHELTAPKIDMEIGKP